MSIGTAVKLARNNIGFTKKELAEQVGLSPSTITRIENNERSMSLQTAQDIAGALGLKLSELVIIAESILKPEDEIKDIQRRLLLSIQPILRQGTSSTNKPIPPKRSSSKLLPKEPHRTV